MSKENAIAALKQKIRSLNSSFRIQAGHPVALLPREKTFAEVAEIFPVLFSENDECAWLFWNDIPVRFHYTYELYRNFDDLLVFLEKLAFETQGQHEFILVTDVFVATIEANWTAPQLQLNSHWQVHRSHQKMADHLNQKNTISTTTQQFLGEWKIILSQIINTIKKTNITINQPAEKDKIQRLYPLVNAIAGQGEFYTPAS